jgi:murein DD-endopeptidase MepM/ murein hydrolase activator NlpD
MNRIGVTSKNKKRSYKQRLTLSGIAFGLLLFSGYAYFSRSTVTPPEREPRQETPPLIVEGTLKPRDTLYESFVRKKIPIRWIELIVSELRSHMDFRRIKGGTYRFITDIEGELVRFLFEKSPTEVYEIAKGPDGYVTKQKEILLDRRLVKVEGEIRSSLYEAINAAGERDSLALSFAEILACEIDFYQDLQNGDRFTMIVDKIYKGETFIDYGTIYGVAYEQGEKIIRGIRYRDGYYSEEAGSLRKPFLKAPLRFDRISSRFSGARRHPILGGLRPHYGVDYAAPTGTPVWAVADGTVVSVGSNSGFGKQVVIRHMNGYTSFYGHLSRYGRGIRKAVRVSQKQIIGYVGSTGLSTGPHLDYRLTKNGQFRNPLEEFLPSGYSLGNDDLRAFQKTKDEIIALMTCTAFERSK